jgi:hypothetical protein
LVAIVASGSVVQTFLYCAQARAHLYQHKELSSSHQKRHLKVTKAGEDGNAYFRM